MIRSTLYGLLVLATSTVSSGQQLDIDWIELSGGKVIVHYSLDDPNPNHQYQVSLFCSHDKFVAPLTKVTGDVGVDIKSGKDKKITWAISDELPDYKGLVSMEIHAKVFLPFMRLTDFDNKKGYKKGRTYPLTWTSGNMGGAVDLELFDGTNRIHRDPNVPNTGKFEWSIPGHIKPGSHYKLRFTDTRNRSEFIETSEFKIVPRIPLWAKAGGVAVVGTAVYIILTLDRGKKLPNPPGFPDP